MSQELLKVALISGGLPLGGSTTFLLNLAGELVHRQISVLVVSLEGDNAHAEDFRLRGIPLHVEDDRTRIFEDRLASALRVLREFKPTTVVACLGPSSFEILRYLPRGVMKLGMIQSDYPEVYPPFIPYVPLLEGMVAVSRQIETNLRAHPRFGTIPTHYLPYGVEVPKQLSGRISRKPQEGERVRILYLGRLSEPQKRVRLFPEFLEQLRASRVPLEWTIAGDGPERSWLHQHMKPREDNVQIRFTGLVPYEQVPALLREHDIFLLASDAEGLPLSLLEAMGHGLVPVVSDLASGVSEVADPTCAILVPPDEVNGYAEGIIRLAKDPTELALMGRRAAEKVRAGFSVEAMTDSWLGVLQQSKGAQISPWPSRFDIRAPWSHPSRLRFSLGGRLLRRWWAALGVRRRSSPR